MFELIDVEDHIPLPAPTFPKELASFPLCTTSSESAKFDEQQQQQTGTAPNSIDVLADTRSRFRHALLSAIGAKFLFRVVPEVGLVVSVASLLHVADDINLLPGQSKVWVHCHFTLVVFKPQVGNRLRAKIVEQSPTIGIRLSVEFFDQIYVPPQCLVEGSEWEPTIQQWGIRDASGAFIRYVTLQNNNNNNQNKVQQQQQQVQQDGAVAATNGKEQPATIDGDDDNENGGTSPVAADPANQPPNSVSAAAGKQQEQEEEKIVSTSTQPGSVICVIDKVSIISHNDEQQQHQMNALMGSNNNNNSVIPGSNSNNTNNSSSTTGNPPPSMKILANFSSCDGLGPEAWFEENA